MEQEVPLVLSEPITAAGPDGAAVDVLAVQLVAPSRKMIRKTLQLQSYLTRAMMESASLFTALASEPGPEGQQDPGLDAEAVRMAIMASTVSADACVDEFEKLALLGAITVDDCPINRIQLDKMHPVDLITATFEYMAAFIAASVMPGS